jgi:vacuolar-type H+-ATPase subunit I/STV1
MKTTFKFGIGIAVASFVMGLILFFLGLHNDPEKLATGQIVGSVGGLLISIVGLTMALKARREEFAPEEGFGSGRAFGTGVLTSVWSSILGAILTIVYASVINPDMQEILVETEIAKMEDNGVPAGTIEQAEGMINIMTSPAVMGAMNLIFGFIFGVILSLIIAAFVKRDAVDVVPPPVEA